jgi:hypothetical protein
MPTVTTYPGVFGPYTPITFTRASTATYFDSAGVLQSAAIDAPRFDYNPSTLAAQGFLIEEARTNLVLQSEDFATTWSALNVTPSTNTALSPAGTLTADTLTPAASTAAHLISQSATVTASIAYSASVFVKTDGAPFVQVVYDNGASAGAFINVNLSTGAITRGPELAGGATNVTGSVTAVNNGFYRVTVGATHTGTTGRIIISPLPTGQSAAGLNPSTTTAATDKVIVWGAQLEAGSFPTSYIPTTTTALTRSADVASVNTLSPWYNQTEGTVYAELQSLSPLTAAQSVALNKYPHVWQIDAGATDSNPFWYGVGVELIIGGTYNNVGVVPSGINKFAVSLAPTAGQSRSSLNGAAAVNRNGTLTGTATLFSLGKDSANNVNNFLNGWLRRLTYYPRALSAAELPALTA